MIRIIKPGILTTVQDLGRPHFAHLGVSTAGAADRRSLSIANIIVSNPANTAALECTLLGPVLHFESRATVAIAGSATSTGLPLLEVFEVASGQRLNIGSLTSGARAYVAVRGGISVPAVMHSAATLLPAAIGGCQGRALRAADTLAIGKRSRNFPRKLRDTRFLAPSTAPIRVTETMQSDWFTASTLRQFEAETFRVSDQSNRSGIRLQGAPIVAHRRSELLTEGVSLGAIQVPSDGQPIILFVDQQTTGGYPKIANVISADFPRVAQLRPRDPVNFQFVSFTEAVDLLRQQERLLREAFE